MPARPTLHLGCAAALVLGACGASAHEFRVGAIVVDHPYAVTSAAGSSTGEVYFRGLKNTGVEPDRLTSVRTARAGEARVQRLANPAGSASSTGDALELPPGAEVRVRHGGPWLVQLSGLKAPLRKRDTFSLILRFEHAGEVEVPVTVELPRPSRQP